MYVPRHVHTVRDKLGTETGGHVPAQKQSLDQFFSFTLVPNIRFNTVKYTAF
ncbi:hypothetical protein WVIC16_130104 [Weissella viridescens]|nr:hypothetical protein WVIC16_130104 [Weissella viridescens]